MRLCLKMSPKAVICRNLIYDTTFKTFYRLTWWARSKWTLDIFWQPLSNKLVMLTPKILQFMSFYKSFLKQKKKSICVKKKHLQHKEQLYVH